jgi:hypothetical protein
MASQYAMRAKKRQSASSSEAIGPGSEARFNSDEERDQAGVDSPDGMYIHYRRQVTGRDSSHGKSENP